LHADSIVIDGLIIAKWNRELFEDMRKGGLTAANCTVVGVGGLSGHVNNIAASQKLIRENSDLVIRCAPPPTSARPRNRARPASSSASRTPMRSKTRSATSRCSSSSAGVQMCYNTQNLVGTGCYERDGGLSGFGREIVAEMNRVGIMCDLSHVGSKTSEEVILESKNRSATPTACRRAQRAPAQQVR
jgi:membrane dipeptidase